MTDGKPKSGKLVQYWESGLENGRVEGGAGICTRLGGWLQSSYLDCFVLEEY